jgi:transposase
VPEAIEAVGARLLYLPPYFPDFNPIENMWSKIKQILRSQVPRTATELIAAAKIDFQAISLSDCQGFLLNAKYAA